MVKGVEFALEQAINTSAAPTMSNVLQSMAKGMLATAEKTQAVESANKLAGLRRLTPEQEAAAAKAAQRIGELAAAAEAAP